MNPTKALLIVEYGYKCMLCDKNDRHVQWHHIKPKYASKAEGKAPDNSFENGSLLCPDCHCEIHRHLWGDDEYMRLTNIILEKKKHPK